jgi:peptide-methionine (S)-S-oxide reductase
MKHFLFVSGLLLGSLLASFGAKAQVLQTAIFAGGCFWCVEADFDKVAGVVATTSGYTGGTTRNPTYKKVSRGGTGYYEAVKIEFDPNLVSYEILVDIFWRTVDPTDAGGQFCDRGDSYRTAIFTTSVSQKAVADASKAALQRSGRLGKPIVTPIVVATRFYPAERYHQNYYQKSRKILTRYGRISKSKAYKKYRAGCGRDARVRQLWGSDAFITAGR